MNRQAVHLYEHEVTPVGLWSLRAEAPTVAVVVSLNFPGLTPHTRDLMRRFTRTALQTLVNTGARPVLIDSSAAHLPDPARAASADALLVLGGGDVDSTLYGRPGPVPHEHGVDPRADRYTIELITHSLQHHTPLLAICRGSHLLNLACGGTLNPHLDTSHHHHSTPGTPHCPAEDITLEPGTKLAALYHTRHLTVRSNHHQALHTLAPELRIAALAQDGTIEATEHRTHPWAIGVQWHPEDTHAPTTDRTTLFTAFTHQAQQNHHHSRTLTTV